MKPKYRPGMVIENRQRFVVCTDTYADGRPKLRHLGDHKVIVAARWRVIRNSLMEPLGVAPYWVAKGGDDEWELFCSWAEAYAWADSKARQQVRPQAAAS